METVNERTTLTVRIAFFDEDDVAVVPISATYRVDDIGSGTAIKGVTNIAALAVTKDIVVTEEQQYIINEANLYESRRMTVDFRYGAGSAKRGTDEYIWKVKNLPGVATSASSSASASAS